MSIFNGLESIVREDCPLQQFTWYGLGGNAEYLVQPKTSVQLAGIVKRCAEAGMPIHTLGFGSNLLISDEGVKGVVLKLDSEEFCKYEFNGNVLTAWAGVNLNKLVLDSVRKGLSGLEALAGIPGSLGGAVRMNAGGSFGDIGASVKSVTVMDELGEIFERSKPDLQFDYRWTNITAPVILKATLELGESDQEAMLKTVKEVWIYKKNSQPLNTKNAGCIFKNPRGMSAGALIDRAGLKGTQMGGAVISEKHANFITTEKGCTATDVKQLIELVRTKVKDMFDVQLETEIEIW